MFRKIVCGIAAVACLVPNVVCGTFKQVTNFGSNPTGVQMFLYTPTKLASSPAVIVAIHYCTGTGQGYYQGTKYANLAETYGYYVIYPDAPDPGGCWDVHTTETLTHNAGGDSLGIASMVRYAINTLGADSTRIFSTGSSSGAMMTNVLLGAYPDLFKAGTAYSGVPYGCFAGSSLWNSQCAQGKLIKTGQQWGDQVRSGYPGYAGARPRFRTYHGTADTTLYYQNLVEQNKEWSNVLGLSFTSNTTNSPLSGYTTMKYGDGTQYQAVSAQGVGHTVPVRETDDLTWFGIIGGSTATSAGTGMTTTLHTLTSTAPSTTTSAAAGSVPKYGQCGGIGWTGAGNCAAGSTCQVINSYYYQCL